MDRQTHGVTNKQTNGQTDGVLMKGPTHRPMNRPTDTQMDLDNYTLIKHGLTDQPNTNGQTDIQTNVKTD